VTEETGKRRIKWQAHHQQEAGDFQNSLGNLIPIQNNSTFKNTTKTGSLLLQIFFIGPDSHFHKYIFANNAFFKDFPRFSPFGDKYCLTSFRHGVCINYFFFKGAKGKFFTRRGSYGS
jgi:hypothetical protein